jgi:sialate O-acetylesterase
VSQPLSSRLAPIVWSIVLWVAPFSLEAEIKLPRFFSDGMVLQRDGAAPIWGTASPGESIKADLDGQVVSTTADGKGSWYAAFKGLKAGGPHTLTIGGESGAVKLNDVLVGDVWFCWGNDNMTEPMDTLGDLAKDDIAASADPLLRCFTTRPCFPPSDPVHDKPVSDVEGSWAGSSPATVPKFTAYGYYFAKELRQKLGIPIGIIQSSYGGSGIETWMPPEVSVAAGFPEIGSRTAQYAALDELAPKFLDELTAWETKYGRQDPGNKGFAAGWADPKSDISGWTPLPKPGDWSPLGLTNGGVVWIRKTVDLPPEAAGQDLTLHLGDIKNLDHEFGNILGTVYVNGKEVGKFGRVLKRLYMGGAAADVSVPGRLVVAGSNVVAIRVFTQKQRNHPFGGSTKLLDPVVMSGAMKDSGWVAKVEMELPPLPADAMDSRPEPPYAPSVMRLPGIFYNHMLHPFVGYGIKGVAAYHGEGNAHVGEAYRRLFPAFIQFWRTEWKDDSLPFCFTQLADVWPPPPRPGISDWSEVRESQLLTWQQVPHTGMAVTVDIGDADVHLKRKKEAAHRLVLVASAVAYGQKIVASGPIYDSMTVEQSKIRIRFSHLGGGLVVKDSPLKQFSIAGSDRKFVWAEATLDGDTALVSSDQVPNPVAVRYAWSDNPAGCNLYNREGLPASPFRTDDWPLHTHGNTVRDLLLTLLRGKWLPVANSNQSISDARHGGS